MHVGPILCLERLADGRDRAALAATGAIAVDMESAWLAPLRARSSFAVLRVVSDGPGHELFRPSHRRRTDFARCAHFAPRAPALITWAQAAPDGDSLMPVPLRQTLRIGTYLMKQKLFGRKKFPLIVELEPLFACNLACAGCGKIQYPKDILKKRMSVEDAIRGDRGVRLADGLDRGRRAADPPRDPRDRGRR